jgi:cytochrome c553
MIAMSLAIGLLSGSCIVQGINREFIMSKLNAVCGTSSFIAVAGAFLASHVVAAQPDLATPPDAASCITCHGAHGEGAPTGAPRLAGQNAAYMSHALSMFKAKTRASPIMQPIAQTLSGVQMSELANYFSKQTAPLADEHSAASPQLLQAGKQLAEVGVANVAACFSCHGEQGKGNGARFPSIAGQPAQFVIVRLHEFQARARAQVPQPGTMTAIAATLTESQIQATAAYLSRPIAAQRLTLD